MTVSVLKTADLQDISGDLLLDNGKIKLLPAADYSKYRWEDFRYFCHVHARYGIPTVELVEFITNIIGGRPAIEIGAGAGDLGYHLGIPMTDSKQQENPVIADAYKAMGQPVITYPDDVEKLDALQAVYKYKPKVVIASWITPYAPHEMPYASNPFGIQEDKILKLVETLIIIGNIDEHDDKPIRKFPHETTYKHWLVSRAKNPQHNCIFIWDKK